MGAYHLCCLPHEWCPLRVVPSTGWEVSLSREHSKSPCLGVWLLCLRNSKEVKNRVTGEVLPESCPGLCSWRAWKTRESQILMCTGISQGFCQNTDSGSVGLRRGSRFCITNEFPGVLTSLGGARLGAMSGLRESHWEGLGLVVYSAWLKNHLL